MTHTTGAKAAFNYSVSALCELTGVGRTKIFELIKNGSLPSIRVGSRRLILGEPARRFFGVNGNHSDKPSPSSEEGWQKLYE